MLLVLLALSAGVAAAQELPRRPATSSDVWSEPNPGLRFLHRTTSTPCEVYVLVADLRAPGVRLSATPYAERWSTVSEAARAHGHAAAINGGFWGALQRPRGLAAGAGELWPTAALDDPEMGALVVDARGRAAILPPGAAVDGARIAEAVSGRPMLVVAGAIDEAGLGSFPTANDRQPRTAVGLGEAGRVAILAVVDGRRSESRGMTLYELARLMLELGAHDALNLDGGGSSEMVVARAGGIVNVPSRSRLEAALEDGVALVSPHGAEREVLNHLAVSAPEPPPAPVGSLDPLAGLPPPDPIRRSPAPRAFRLGQAREVLVPALWLVPLLIGIALARRLRRRPRVPPRVVERL